MAENKTKIKTEADFLTENSKLEVVQKGKKLSYLSSVPS